MSQEVKHNQCIGLNVAPLGPDTMFSADTNDEHKRFLPAKLAGMVAGLGSQLFWIGRGISRMFIPRRPGNASGPEKEPGWTRFL
jgi:hypothetical protein